MTLRSESLAGMQYQTKFTPGPGFSGDRIYLIFRTNELTYAEFFSQRFDLISWVGTHGQETDERLATVAFAPRLLQVQDDRISVALTHRVGNVSPGLGDCTIGAPRPM